MDIYWIWDRVLIKMRLLNWKRGGKKDNYNCHIIIMAAI